MPAIQSLSSPSRIFAWCGARFAGTGVEALFALDRQLGDIVRTTQQPIVGQMRLTWWNEALERLDSGPAPAQPLLQELAGAIGDGRISGRALATMTEGWEILLHPDRDDTGSLARFAQLRGATLFRAAASLICQDNPAVDRAGTLWAYADLAANVSVSAVRARASEAALELAELVFANRWRDARPLGAIGLDASMAMAGRGTSDGPRRAARAARFRMIGR